LCKGQRIFRFAVTRTKPVHEGGFDDKPVLDIKDAREVLMDLAGVFV
jgi:hypothetical protein